MIVQPYADRFPPAAGMIAVGDAAVFAGIKRRRHCVSVNCKGLAVNQGIAHHKAGVGVEHTPAQRFKAEPVGVPCKIAVLLLTAAALLSARCGEGSICVNGHASVFDILIDDINIGHSFKRQIVSNICAGTNLVSVIVEGLLLTENLRQNRKQFLVCYKRLRIGAVFDDIACGIGCGFLRRCAKAK